MIINGIVPDIKAPNTGALVIFTVLSFFLPLSLVSLSIAGSVVKNALMLMDQVDFRREAEKGMGWETEKKGGPKTMT